MSMTSKEILEKHGAMVARLEQKELRYKKSKEDPDRLVQIMPAQGWQAVYRNKEGNETRQTVIGWGLTLCGMVHPLVASQDGGVDPANAAGNFVRVEEARPTV